MRKGDATLASYMLFDYCYCNALIDMGYNDLMARREAMQIFFSADVCPLPTLIRVSTFDPSRTVQFGAEA